MFFRQSLEQRDALCSQKRTLGCGLEIPRLYYKGFAGSKVPVRFDGEGRERKIVVSVDRSGEQELQFAAFVGIDFADQKHVWCLQAADSQKRESGELEHSPEAVEVWVAQLCQRFAQGPIAVALEQSRGGLVFMPASLFPVPSTMAATCETRCIHLVPRMIRGMPTCSWIYC